jgi:hypothetical protein
MPKTRITTKVVRNMVKNLDVNAMVQGIFTQTGEGRITGDVETTTYPKYLKIQEKCTRFIQVLRELRASVAMSHFQAEAEHLGAYVDALEEQAAAIFIAPDLKAAAPPAVKRARHQEFTRVYQAVKESNLVKTMIVTCRNLIDHKRSIINLDSLQHRFLTRTAGLSLAPLPDLPALNFKQLYIDDRQGPADSRYILETIHWLFKLSHELYEILSTPDVDVEEFIAVVVAGMDSVKKAVPRCDEAFKGLMGSIGIFRGRFNEYYKDFIATNNPSIIMENFIIDVSHTAETSPRILAQYRRIIAYYRKMISKNNIFSNSKLQSVFQMLDSNIHELEKRSREVAADDAAEEPAAEEPAAEEPAAATGGRKKPRAPPAATRRR